MLILALALVAAGVALGVHFGKESRAGVGASNQSPIGKPFELSPSVRDYCKAMPSLAMCQAFSPLLAQFLAEKRDARWAAPIEARIENFMRVGGQPKVEIRSLECRSSHCALEYAVRIDGMDFDVDGDPELEKLVESMGGVMAPEVGATPAGHRMVSVMIWKKVS
jgi:hypothetical protein